MFYIMIILYVARRCVWFFSDFFFSFFRNVQQTTTTRQWGIKFHISLRRQIFPGNFSIKNKSHGERAHTRTSVVVIELNRHRTELSLNTTRRTYTRAFSTGYYQNIMIINIDIVVVRVTGTMVRSVCEVWNIKKLTLWSVLILVSYVYNAQWWWPIYNHNIISLHNVIVSTGKYQSGVFGFPIQWTSITPAFEGYTRYRLITL